MEGDILLSFWGWLKNEKGEKGIAYWSSQASTNGYADVISDSIERISKVKTVRLTQPEKLFEFNINQPVKRKIPGDPIE